MSGTMGTPSPVQDEEHGDRRFLGLLPSELEAFCAWLPSQGAVGIARGRTDVTAWVRWEEGPLVRIAIREFLNHKGAHEAVVPSVGKGPWRMVVSHGIGSPNSPSSGAVQEEPKVRVGEDRVRWGVPWGAPNMYGVTKIECSRRGDPLRESIAWHRILATTPAPPVPDPSESQDLPGSQSSQLFPSPTFRPAPFLWAIVVLPWHHDVPTPEIQQVIDSLGMFRDNPTLDDQRRWFLEQVSAVKDTTPGQQHWGTPDERRALMRRLEVGLSHWEQLAYPMRHWVERLLAHPGIASVADRDLVKACLAHHEPQIRMAGLRLLGETGTPGENLHTEDFPSA